MVRRLDEIVAGTGPAGFLNPTLYDIGLTRGTSVDLYAACFNDIADGGSNANGFPGGTTGLSLGFTSVPGYDLCTGLGSPKPALITQLASPTPADAVFREIRFIIGTGDDDLRGNGGFGSGCVGSGCTADVFWPGRRHVDLHAQAARHRRVLGELDQHRDRSTSAIPATDINGDPVPVLNQSKGIEGVRINMQEGNHTFPCTADNWDIASLNVSLVAPTLVDQPALPAEPDREQDQLQDAAPG